MRKGTRPIRVDGTTYRWCVRGRSAQVTGTPLAFAVEQAHRTGSVLVVTTSGWPAAGAFVLTPTTVAGAIRRARQQGWRPDRPGPPFRLTLSAV